MSLNVAIVQGNAVVLSFSVKDPRGSPLNLTSWGISEVIWVIKETINSTIPLVTKLLSTEEITIRDYIDGQIDVNVLPQDTKELAGNYVHEMVIYNNNGDVLTVTADIDAAYGEFVIRKSIAYA